MAGTENERSTEDDLIKVGDCLREMTERHSPVREVEAGMERAWVARTYYLYLIFEKPVECNAV
ncbi:hypothetical protein [Saccharothrix sp. NRRL B-16348]|uniref:hypothetical protein n=1 Tax=Saccharothrix sp. NRRL B-16348 TaxID=1415542 RepID=UPI000B18B6A3|nr:hypothetical protein [Saccharothrix sp. NRRL B-16348]